MTVKVVDSKPIEIVVCRVCGATLSYDRKDVKNKGDSGDYIICVVCESKIFFSDK